MCNIMREIWVNLLSGLLSKVVEPNAIRINTYDACAGQSLSVFQGALMGLSGRQVES